MELYEINFFNISSIIPCVMYQVVHEGGEIISQILIRLEI